MAEAQRGDADAAAAALAERDATGHATIELFATEAMRSEGWALAARGDRPAALRRFHAAAEVADAAGLRLHAADARFDAVRLGDRDQAVALAAAAAEVDSRTIELAARWAAHPDDGALLDEVGAGLEALDGLMMAADAFAAAAAAWRSAGASRQATASEQRAADLVRRCGAAPVTVAIAEPVAPLTGREREIVVLVADGLSTKEVAERLYLSPRTVSNHLQNAYTKLGVSKRSELPAALGRLGEAQPV
jgi:DNA-binding CsgD family transcriptional regulator